MMGANAPPALDALNRENVSDYPAQQQLIASLRDPDRYPYVVKNVRVVETHISWVVLAGRYAYKVKKAVDLGFLDFTDQEVRRFYCEEEIRLNRRLAPQLYLDVIAIGGSPERPVLGASPAIEYAVRMRRFATSKQMDYLLARGRVAPCHIDQLAATISQFHSCLLSATPDSTFGSLDAIYAPVLQNFKQLAPLMGDLDDMELLSRIRNASEYAYTACVPCFEQRKKDGMVRECHGDLHLGNIALVNGRPIPFDCIEFNAGLRWIDVMSEVAFMMMDLLDRNRADLAFRFLNAYLELTGDYAGVTVLPFYLSYRAMVRAKIDAIRAHQLKRYTSEAKAAMAACRSYLVLAEGCLSRRNPALIITHGLPGCGKTTVAQAALERLQAIRIRSDVERKRLFGLVPSEDSHSQVGKGVYTAEATRRTYVQLLGLARGLLEAGFPVIVDAAFLKHAEREHFQKLASEMGVPFLIISVKVEESILRQRITQRQNHGNDASEADLAVLQALQATYEPLLPQEFVCSVDFSNDGDIGNVTAKGSFWDILASKCCRH